MFNRPFTTLNRITIEAVDCNMNYHNINGHLTISLEPRTPVYSTSTNADPILPQVQSPQTRTQTVSLTSPTTSDRSTPPLPSTTTDTIKTDLTLGDTLDTSCDIASLLAPQPNTKQDTDPSVVNQNTNMDIDFTSNFDFSLSTYFRSPQFQDKIKHTTTVFTEGDFNVVKQQPHRVRDWILQILDSFPTLLDDTSNSTPQESDTSSDQQIELSNEATIQTPPNSPESNFSNNEVNQDIELSTTNLLTPLQQAQDGDRDNDTDHEIYQQEEKETTSNDIANLDVKSPDTFQEHFEIAEDKISKINSLPQSRERFHDSQAPSPKYMKSSDLPLDGSTQERRQLPYSPQETQHTDTLAYDSKGHTQTQPNLHTTSNNTTYAAQSQHTSIFTNLYKEQQHIKCKRLKDTYKDKHKDKL